MQDEICWCVTDGMAYAEFPTEDEAAGAAARIGSILGRPVTIDHTMAICLVGEENESEAADALERCGMRVAVL